MWHSESTVIFIILVGLFYGVHLADCYAYIFINNANCQKPLQIGSMIMGFPAKPATSTSHLVITRNGVILNNFTTYKPEEKLSISVAVSGEYVVDVTKGIFSNAKNLGCSNKRYHDSPSGVLQLPIMGSGDVVIQLGYATSESTVYIQNITLMEDNINSFSPLVANNDANEEQMSNQNVIIVISVIGGLLFLIASCHICSYHIYYNHQENSELPATKAENIGVTSLA